MDRIIRNSAGCGYYAVIDVFEILQPVRKLEYRPHVFIGQKRETRYQGTIAGIHPNHS